MTGYAFEKQTEFSVVRFSADLLEMERAEIEGKTAGITQLAKDAALPAVLVDLTELQRPPQGLVALLVQLRRELDSVCRRFVIVAPRDEVRTPLRHAGVGGLWDLHDSLEAANAAAQSDAGESSESKPAPQESNAGVSNTTISGSPNTAARDSSPASESSAAGEELPFVFEEQRGYSSVQFNPVLMSMGWSEVESATTEVLQKLKASKNNSVMVDLGPMRIINSGLVASLVRIWKTMQAKKGQFSLVSPNEMVTEVLKSAGLWKLWTVVDDREEAVYELGAGEVAQVEKRERRLLMLVAVPCSLIAVLALVLKYSSDRPSWGANAHLAALLLAAAALATGFLSIVKDNGFRRIFSLLAVLMAAGVLSSLWFDENPVALGKEMLNLNKEIEHPPLRRGNGKIQNQTNADDDSLDGQESEYSSDDDPNDETANDGSSASPESTSDKPDADTTNSPGGSSDGNPEAETTG